MATETPSKAAQVGDPAQVGFYMQTFGNFVKSYNLGGTVDLRSMNLRDNKD